ncbi:hypothetical protein MCUN1_003126 [Malassezia cuniculi]|uniref:Protein phosphatase inhibitor 2 (IPP-2) n=1 Tax=Malassezia cuniculi TaxID=948313 RepID=A0AAF0F0Y5_9BASI|nr:hypothetical protein MCUN1_003126 [Malassezia cuniculi]
MARHEPLPSALTPKPKGILKNAHKEDQPTNLSGDHSHLHWDEHNLTEHEIEREHSTRMIIDEPKTPFVHSASVPSMDDDNFSIGASVQPPAAVSPEALDEKLQRYVEEDPVVANTRANASTNAIGAELKKAGNGHSATVPGDDGVDQDEEHAKHATDPEGKHITALLTTPAEARHAEFTEMRHRHYGNEAQALKLAAQLAEEEDDD